MTALRSTVLSFALALCVAAAATPARAQTASTPPPAPSPAPAPAPSKPAPKHHHHHPKATPVVQAPANPHAQRPAGKAGTTAPAPTAAAAAPAVPAPDAAKPPEPPKGTVTGLPLPRWAALRADEVNLRVGPGTRFPIEWQYHRRDLPVEILREVEVWRLIEDQDGVKGWVHQATLVGHRSFVVKGPADALVRRSPDDAAEAVARLKPGVVGRLRSCAAGSAWCEVQVGDYRGYLRRIEFWGAFDGEAVN